MRDLVEDAVAARMAHLMGNLAMSLPPDFWFETHEQAEKFLGWVDAEARRRLGDLGLEPIWDVPSLIRREAQHAKLGAAERATYAAKAAAE